MTLREYDPRQGQAFQGDVAIIPIPPDIEVATGDEIQPVEGRLIMQQGEATGHHHVIELGRQRMRFFRGSPGVAPEIGLRATRTHPAIGGGGSHATARLYRDPNACAELSQRGILTRIDLAIGCLVVAGGSVVISHEEHDGIRLPPGNYYVGRQAESADGAQRFVQD
jgi:hypothetical protein